MYPLTQIPHKSEQHIEQQCCPNLSPNRVGTGANESAELECLFDLLEENHDLPPRSVEFADRLAAPLDIVFDESHQLGRAVDLHPGFHATKSPGSQVLIALPSG